MPFRSATWNFNEVARWLYILVVIVAACIMAVLFVLIINDRSEIRKEANIRATQIQQQRYDAVFQSCTEQNNRNTDSIKKLHKVIAQRIKRHPKEALRARESEKPTIVLINALVPKRNCRVAARKAVHPLANPQGK